MKRLFLILYLMPIYISVGSSEGKPMDYTPMIKDRLKRDYLRHIDRLMYAQIFVESRGNRFAISPFGDYGILQIRQIKLDDYFQKTGIRYTLQDCFNFEISKEIYLFYAKRIGVNPENWETIARAWAGGLSRAKHECTLNYWVLVSKRLNKTI